MTFKELEGKGVVLERALRGEAGERLSGQRCHPQLTTIPDATNGNGPSDVPVTVPRDLD